MILGGKPQLFELDQLQQALEDVERAVVRVRATEPKEFLACGFFLLPDLIVVPAFAFKDVPPQALIAEHSISAKEYRRFTILEREDAGHIELTSLARSGAPEGALITLLRTSESNDSVIHLQFATTELNEFVAIPQFVFGRASASIAFGNVLSITDLVLGYNADTAQGSSGAPVLDDDFQLIAMHLASSPDKHLNEGITRAALVDALRESSYWDRIREAHRIADVVAASAAVSDAVASEAPPEEPADAPLLRAALRAKIDPNSDDADALRPHVADPDAPVWALPSSTRTEILSAAGSLEALRPYAPDPATAANEPLQRVILRVLDGPPYDLAQLTEEELPYWIQASNWFANVAPDLPEPAQVTHELEQRRVRSSLERIASKDFTGRDKELTDLQQWWDAAKQPLSLSGIGGIGKSALVARFASTLPRNTLLLWLDFDRPDLAPDDAPSILAALAQQASVQLDGFSMSDLDFENASDSAAKLGQRIEEKIESPALLVLDSFEAAQYSARYEELWTVLEAIATTMPSLRLIVTGRAPVPGLALRGASAQTIDLKGLEPDDAREWLRARGIDDDAILDQLLQILGGVPLNLHLALRVFQRDGSMPELPKNMPPEMVAGFLYDRILDRVQPGLKPLAKAVLVVRRITADMLLPVFGDAVQTLTAETAEGLFADLAREMALIEGTTVLKLRSEVRRPSLKLLEDIEPDFVRALDAKAEAWFADPSREATSNAEIAAELVYHRLRLGNLSGAAQAWRDGSRRFLLDAGDELPPPSLEWLHARLGNTEGGDSEESQAAAAANVASRVRNARGRRKKGAINSILSNARSQPYASELVFHEAYERWRDGNEDEALALLDDGGDAPAMIGRDRNVLRALLLSHRDQRDEADSLLLRYENLQYWTDRSTPPTYVTAVRAARIQLTEDLNTELNALTSGDYSDLTSFDVILPQLRTALAEDHFALESTRSLFGMRVEEPRMIRGFVDKYLNESLEGTPERLRQLARTRWRLATDGSFLIDAAKLTEKSELTPIEFSIVSILALFAATFSVPHDYYDAALVRGNVPILQLLSNALGDRTVRIDASHQKQVERIFSVLNGDPENLSWRGMPLRAFPEDERPLLIYLVTPNPLEQLVHELAGYTSEAR